MLTPAEVVERLLQRLNSQGAAWPPKQDAKLHQAIKESRAFLDSDRTSLAALAGWPKGKRYRVDPLPAAIAHTWADFIFGEDPAITAGNENDAEALADLLSRNPSFVDDLKGAAEIQVAEGEVWYRIFRDGEAADAPVVEWHSREQVVPLWIGRRLVAAAFVAPVAGPGKGVYRTVEIHAEGRVETHLYSGTDTVLGKPCPLDTCDATTSMADVDPTGMFAVWDHGLPMLAGRVRNPRGRDRTRGVSDFEAIRDQLLDLNEAASIGAANMRLTARKRVVVPEGVLRQGNSTDAASSLSDNGDGTLSPAAANQPKWDESEDVLVQTELDTALGTEVASEFKVLEYSFDAAPLIAYKLDLVETALTRIGLTAQVVGTVSSDTGYAVTGTALRLRMIPTIRTARGKGRSWDGELPRLLSVMQQLDALAETLGGFGRPWVEAEAQPAVELRDGLPVDSVEEASVEAALVSAGVRSRYQSVVSQHPDWTPEQIEAEVLRIRDDRSVSGPGFA